MIVDLSAAGPAAVRLAGVLATLCCALLLSACDGLSDEEYTAVKAWLACEECNSGERAAVAAFGPGVKTILAEALVGIPADRRENLRQQFAESHNRINSQVADSAEFVNGYLSDYESSFRKRAAQSLGDIGAIDELQEALDSAESRGYRDDVIREVYRALSAAKGTVTWVHISADTGYSCGVLDSGDAFCWGGTDHGEMGARSIIDSSNVPVRVSFGRRFTSIATAVGHTCGLTTDSTVYCWGLNHVGQMGDASATMERSSPGRVSGGLVFRSVVAGGFNVCADSASGTLFCWGWNVWGQVGDGTSANIRNVPTRVAGSLVFDLVSFGTVHTCGLTVDSLAYCWGRNNEGQLGDGTVVDRSTPTVDIGVPNLVRITAGNGHSCAIALGGTAYCWGRNDMGQLGDGTLQARFAPVEVSGSHVFASISAGTNLSAHTCGINTDEEIYCWGSNSHGQLGDGTTTDRIEPVLVNAPGLRFTQVSAAMSHTCAITVDGEAYCWGRNLGGRLGDGSSTDSPVPVQVVDPPIP